MGTGESEDHVEMMNQEDTGHTGYNMPECLVGSRRASAH